MIRFQRTSWRWVGLALMMPFLATAGARSGVQICEHCQREACCEKICRLVPEDKKITVTCWGAKEEEFCVPGRSQRGCENCEWVCGDDGDPKSPCSQPKKLFWTDWLPGNCGKVYTRTKLMKRTITKTVKSYKWVVEEVCAQCEADCPPTVIDPQVELPIPPAVDAKLK